MTELAAPPTGAGESNGAGIGPIHHRIGGRIVAGTSGAHRAPNKVAVGALLEHPDVERGRRRVGRYRR